MTTQTPRDLRIQRLEREIVALRKRAKEREVELMKAQADAAVQTREALMGIQFWLLRYSAALLLRAHGATPEERPIFAGAGQATHNTLVEVARAIESVTQPHEETEHGR